MSQLIDQAEINLADMELEDRIQDFVLAAGTKRSADVELAAAQVKAKNAESNRNEAGNSLVKAAGGELRKLLDTIDRHGEGKYNYSPDPLDLAMDAFILGWRMRGDATLPAAEYAPPQVFRAMVDVIVPNGEPPFIAFTRDGEKHHANMSLEDFASVREGKIVEVTDHGHGRFTARPTQEGERQ